MASERTPEQLEAVRAAMMADIGFSRLEDLPMEDGEADRCSRRRKHGSISFDVISAVPRSNRWSEAINGGQFDDDDAAQVKHLDSLADGNLSRMRRKKEASDAATNITTADHQHQYSEQNLARDKNGYVRPRAKFNGSTGRPPRIPLSNSGDDPINISLISGDVRSARPRHKSTAGSSLPGPANQQVRAALPARDQAPSGARSLGAARSRQSFQGIASHSPTPSSSNIVVENENTQPRPVLPAGAIITLEVPSAIKSRSFPTIDGYPGMVYLVQTKNQVDDFIIFTLQDRTIDDVHHLIKEFDDIYPADEAGIMLRFNIPGRSALFYCLDFDHRDKMVSFMRAIRELQRHLKQGVQETAVVATVSAAPSAVPKMDPPEPKLLNQPSLQGATPQDAQNSQTTHTSSVSAISPAKQTANPVETSETSTKNESVQNVPIPSPEAAEAVGVKDFLVPTVLDSSVSHARPVQLARANLDARTVEAKADGQDETLSGGVEGIVQWVVDTALYMRERAPRELSVEIIRAIIHATTTTMMSCSNPTIRGWSPEKQAKLIEKRCHITGEGEFLQWLACGPELVADMKAEETRVPLEPQPVASGKEQEELISETQMLGRPKLVEKVKEVESSGNETQVPTDRRSVVYKTEELLSMRAAAADGFQDLVDKTSAVGHQRAMKPEGQRWLSKKADKAKITGCVLNSKTAQLSPEEERDGEIEQLPDEDMNSSESTKSFPKHFNRGKIDFSEMIGLFVTHTTSDSDSNIRNLFAAEDRAHITSVRNLRRDGMQKVVQFLSTEHRDMALMRLPEECKTGQNRSKPRFSIFVPRSETKITEANDWAMRRSASKTVLEPPMDCSTAAKKALAASSKGGTVVNSKTDAKEQQFGGTAFHMALAQNTNTTTSEAEKAFEELQTFVSGHVSNHQKPTSHSKGLGTFQHSQDSDGRPQQPGTIGCTFTRSHSQDLVERFKASHLELMRETS